MIAKIFPKSSGSFRKRLRYIFGCTKHDHAITHIETISLNCLAKDPLPGIQDGSETDVAAMISEFNQVEGLRRMSIDSERLLKPVFHAMVSLPPGEHLDGKQWAEAVKIYLSDLGFTDDNKFVAVLHRDTDHEHVHIVANRIHLATSFTVVKDSNERETSMDSASSLEDLFILSKAKRPTETWGVAFSHGEVIAAARDGSMPYKAQMIAKIAGSIERTNAIGGDMFCFVHHLRQQQIYVHLSTNELGQVRGIAYELQGKIISGRKLKRSRLTFQKLIEQEGIQYDPETLPQLETEIARRDFLDSSIQSTYVQSTYLYYHFYHKARKFDVKFEPKSKSQREIDEIVEAIQRFLFALLGVPFESKKEEKRRRARYIEYVPALGLTGKMFAIDTIFRPELESDYGI